MAADDALYYPVMLRLEGQRCLVVGGGGVAARKVRGLLQAGAQVVVVAPSLEETLQNQAERGEIEWLPHACRSADLTGSRLVIAATDDRQTNEWVAAEAGRLGLWVNVVDRPDLCDFVMPAVLRQGRVVVSVSSGGSSPALARELRDRLEEVVGPEYGRLAAMLGGLRDEVKGRIRDPRRRVAFWDAALAGPALRWLRDGRDDLAQAQLRELLDRFCEGSGEMPCA